MWHASKFRRELEGTTRADICFACMYAQRRYFESGEPETLERKCDLRDGSDLLPFVVRFHNIVSANWKVEVAYSPFRTHSIICISALLRNVNYFPQRKLEETLDGRVCRMKLWEALDYVRQDKYTTMVFNDLHLALEREMETIYICA